MSLMGAGQVEAMAIIGGRVGIGSIAPTCQLEVTAATNVVAQRWSYGADTTNYALQLGLVDNGSSDVSWNFTHKTNAATHNVLTFKAGNVGIGTSTPQKKFHVEHTAGASEGILISGASDTVGHTAGILLRAEGGEADSALRAKAGIFLERTATYGIGKLHIANRHNSDNVSATTSDANITIYDDKVGIGTTSPSNMLSVNGVITSGNFTATSVGGTPADANTAEIGPGYINLARDDTASARQITFGKNGAVHSYLETTSAALESGVGNVGIGTTAPSSLLHIQSNDSTTNSEVDMITLTSLSTGTTTTGFGPAIKFQAERNNGVTQNVGKIRSVAEINSGTNISSGLAFETSAVGALNEKMRITWDGNVGIGNTNPSHPLTIGTGTIAAPHSGTPNMVLIGGLTAGLTISNTSNSGTGSIFFGDAANSTVGQIRYNHNTGDMAFTAEDDFTFAGGNVGIGTASPIEKLDVSGYQGIAVNNNYAHMGSTVSGAMAIFGHNIKSDSAGNTIKSANTGYHSSMVKMYYNEGITFHATSGTNTAGDTFYNISGTTNELMRLKNDGNVGIGIVPAGYATSGYALRLDGGSQTYLSWNNDTHTTQVLGGFHIGTDSGAARIIQREDQPIIFSTDDTNRMQITADGVVSAPIASTHGGFLHGGSTPNPAASYLGSNGADFGTTAIYRTPTIQSSSTVVATSQFLTIYTSGHWGEYPVFKFKVYGTYYGGGYKEYMGYMTGTSAALNAVETHGTATFLGGGGNNTITMGPLVSSGLAAHGGQARHRRDFTLTNYGVYGRCYVVVEIMFGGNRYYGSSTSTSTLDALGSSLGV